MGDAYPDRLKERVEEKPMQNKRSNALIKLQCKLTDEN